MLAASCLLYLPLLLAFGPTHWVSLGPLAIQISRIGWYATYFIAGVALGFGGRQAVARFGSAVAMRWLLWGTLAALTGAAFLAVDTLRPGGAFEMSAGSALALSGLARAGFCAAACFALPAFFLRFGGHRTPIWDSLSANSFAIYLLHYPFVTWTQAGLLTAQISAALKEIVVFIVALIASWAGAWLLRRLPGSGQIL